MKRDEGDRWEEPGAEIGVYKDGREFDRITPPAMGGMPVDMLSALTAVEGPACPMLVVAWVEDTSDERTLMLSAIPEAQSGAPAEKSSSLFPAPLWQRVRVDSCIVCTGVVALPRHGIVIVAVCNQAGPLSIHSLETGERLSSATKGQYVTFLTADDESGTVFASEKKDGPVSIFGVSMYKWDGATLTLQGWLPDVTAVNEHMAIAVVPRSGVRKTAHLVVCKRFSHTLSVYALPTLSLVCTHDLDDEAEIVALSASPDGEVIVMSDRHSCMVVTREWPLPGMPEL